MYMYKLTVFFFMIKRVSFISQIQIKNKVKVKQLSNSSKTFE